MRSSIIVAAASLTLMSCESAPRNDDQIFKLENFDYSLSHDTNFVPQSGYADKPEVAVGIAEAVAIGVYGRKQIEKQRPYLVKRLGDRWVVQGSWQYGPHAKGGVFEVEVAALDGRILHMIHGK